jgi:hypothetical protein
MQLETHGVAEQNEKPRRVVLPRLEEGQVNPPSISIHHTPSTFQQRASPPIFHSRQLDLQSPSITHHHHHHRPSS